ncbi:hypothetical protein BJY04DRAFT_217478 [Aspergillus karnatakaensis]|uniref:uncharacterized protein n=1 Tax=Aspergillus karnatakaensis TaxID=1810916 RepID=UPI003CCD1229
MTTGIYILALLFLPATLQAVCYLPNGIPDLDDVNQPCITDSDEVSMCCATNRTNPSGGFLSDGRVSDVCMQNGLCKNIARKRDKNDNVVVVTEYWRDLCTSSEWPEENCVNVCSTGAGDDKVTVQLTPCDGTDNSTEWCCGKNADCCGTDAAVTIANVLPALASSSSTSPSSSTATPSSAPESEADGASVDGNDDNVNNSQSSGELSTGAKAGIGVGAAAAALLGVAVVVYWVRRRRRAKGTGAEPDILKTQSTSPITEKPAPFAYNGNGHIAEADSGDGVSELPGSQMLRHELPADK